MNYSFLRQHAYVVGGRQCSKLIEKHSQQWLAYPAFSHSYAVHKIVWFYPAQPISHSVNRSVARFCI